MIEIQGRKAWLINQYKNETYKNISNFNITDGLLYPLENIEGLKLSDNKIEMVPLDEKIIQYDLSIPKGRCQILRHLRVRKFKKGKISRSLEVKLFAGQEYKDL